MLPLGQEKEIIAKAQKDKRYFEVIFKAYVRSLYAYVFSVLKDKDEAEDVTAETFWVALDNLTNFQWRGVSIKFWLFQIARNQLKKYWRQKQKEVSWNPDIQVESNKEAEILDQLTQKERLEKVKNCLEEMEALDSEVIKLKIWEEFSFEEIAYITGCTVSKVKMRYYRGLEKLKEKLRARGIKED